MKDMHAAEVNHMKTLHEEEMSKMKANMTKKKFLGLSSKKSLLNLQKNTTKN